MTDARSKCLVYTIGYEQLNFSTWLQLIVEAEVDIVIDVRARPLSRKPDFSKTSLQHALSLHLIEYAHVGELGAPQQLRDRLKEDGNVEAFLQGFRQSLESEERRQAIERVAETAEAKTCCLICVEEDPKHCHRSEVARKLEELPSSRFEIAHIRYLREKADSHNL